LQRTGRPRRVGVVPFDVSRSVSVRRLVLLRARRRLLIARLVLALQRERLVVADELVIGQRLCVARRVRLDWRLGRGAFIRQLTS
jgi:hypothetical protein